ncbi:MAG: hypothetical protein KBB52_07775 [Candidatus Omnitrophica bacterium]|nr:hypothetical protein [Candidatus Omnitrophota bacterium]
MKISASNIIVMVGISLMIAFSLNDVESQSNLYDPKGKRDPFVPLIGQGRTSARINLEDVASIADIKLEGIAVGANGKRVAALNGELLKQGDGIGIVKVIKIEAKSVVLTIGGKEYAITFSGEEGGALQ